MQLLVYITNQGEKMPEVLSGLMEQGVSGATVVNCEGMLHLLTHTAGVEKPAMFNRIRTLFYEEGEEDGKMMLAVMPDELILSAKGIIEKVCGGFDQPNTGIMFSLPVMHFEGVTHK